MSSRTLALLLLLTALPPAEAQRPAPRFLAHDSTLKGEGPAELRWPVAVAAGAPLELAVADAHGARLVFFSAAGVGWSAERVLPLDGPPLAVVHDGERYVVAVRGRDQLLTVTGPDAEPASLPLPAGTLPAALAATPAGGLMVYDAAGRVLALDGAGQVAAMLPVDGRVTALAAAADGGFYVALADEARIVRYAASGQVVSDWLVPGDGPVPAWPAGLVLEPGGRLLVADRHAGRVLAIDGAGRLAGTGAGEGWEPGRLLRPSGLARLFDGRLAVADRGNGRVQLFRHLTLEARLGDAGEGSVP